MANGDLGRLGAPVHELAEEVLSGEHGLATILNLGKVDGNVLVMERCQGFAAATKFLAIMMVSK